MRTTVSIDDHLLRRAKTQASAEGRTLSDLVNEGLRERLTRQPAAPSERYVPVTFGGKGLRPGLDLNDNAALRDVMDGR